VFGSAFGAKATPATPTTPAAPAAPAAPAPATPAAAVDKAAYSAWEAEVIAAFFTRSHERTPLMPTDGAPVHLRKEKYILVADAASFQVASGASFGLPAQTYVQLYHLGKHEADGVRFGYAKEEGIFKHPAIDVGGLTNLRQKLGERVDFEGPSTSWGPGASDDVEDVARALASQWNELAMEAFEPPKASDLVMWLRSVARAMGDVTLRFYLLPPEHRVVVTSSDVKAATGGKYYLRTYDNSGGAYAKASDGKGLYCGVTDGFITPNLRESNIVMEYVSENSVRSPPPKKPTPAAEGGLFGRMCKCFSAAS
jgi:hypothetical protein